MAKSKRFDDLIAQLTDPDWSLRRDSAIALGKLGEARVVGPLLDALNDPHKRVLLVVARSLGQLGNAQGIDTLKRIVETESSEASLQYEALMTLSDLGIKQKEKILIAEDEPDIRYLIAYGLTLAGYTVACASDGSEACRLALSETPDLIQLDVRMPKMSGVEACKRIKATPRLQHVPVIFLSAKGQDSDILEGLSAGATEYLLKPFIPEELVNKLWIVLRNKQLGIYDDENNGT